jgi:hypothetical protein
MFTENHLDKCTALPEAPRQDACPFMQKSTNPEEPVVNEASMAKKKATAAGEEEATKKRGARLPTRLGGS